MTQTSLINCFLSAEPYPASGGFFRVERYATKVEKPLRATSCFSIEHAYQRGAYNPKLGGGRPYKRSLLGLHGKKYKKIIYLQFFLFTRFMWAKFKIFPFWESKKGLATPRLVFFGDLIQTLRRKSRHPPSPLFIWESRRVGIQRRDGNDNVKKN